MACQYSSAIDRQGSLLYDQRRLDSFVRNGIDLLTVLLIALYSCTTLRSWARRFVEMLFMLVILRRTLTFVQNTQRSYQRFLDFSGSVRLFEDLERKLSDNEEVLRTRRHGPGLRSSPSGSRTCHSDMTAPHRSWMASAWSFRPGKKWHSWEHLELERPP